MVLRLLIWVAFMLSVPPAAVWGCRRAAARLFPEWSRRRLARRVSGQLHAAVERACVFCGKRDPVPRAYDDGTGWYHQVCFFRAVDDD